VPASPALKHARLDFSGAMLLVAALILLIHALVDPGKPVYQWTSITLAILLGAGFIWREHRVASPMLPLGLFRSRAFSGANLMTLLLYCALSGTLYFLPFDLIQIHGYTALQAGAAFLPFTLILGFGSTLTGNLIRRFNPRLILTIGPLVTAAGFAALAIPGMNADFASGFLPGILLIGIGMTLCVTPLTTVVLDSVKAEQAGVASGVNNTAARLAGVLAVAILTAVSVAQFSGRLNQALQADNIPVGVTSALHKHMDRLAELTAPGNLSGSVADRINADIAQSYTGTFRVLMLICSLLALLSGGIAWLSFPAQRIATASGDSTSS
ncbi:MAG: MFS transporter, partial [Gammaproteobacteria bacterium]